MVQSQSSLCIIDLTYTKTPLLYPFASDQNLGCGILTNSPAPLNPLGEDTSQYTPNYESKAATKPHQNQCTAHAQNSRFHYNYVIISAMASYITGLTIVYLYSGADQRKLQSSTSLAFVRGIHRWPVNSPRKGPVTRKIFPFDDVIMAWNGIWYNKEIWSYKWYGQWNKEVSLYGMSFDIHQCWWAFRHCYVGVDLIYRIPWYVPTNILYVELFNHILHVCFLAPVQPCVTRIMYIQERISKFIRSTDHTIWLNDVIVLSCVSYMINPCWNIII